VLYFDHNATSPLCVAAREAWLAAAETVIGNPSSQHRVGKRAELALEGARERLAALVGCQAHEIVWTSGATEAVNTAIQHFAATREGEAWISALEHPCVIEAARRWFPRRYRFLPALPTGVLDLQYLRDLLAKESPAFVAVMAANNETGVLQPWREVEALCTERGVTMLCDAAQWIGKLPAEGLGGGNALVGCAHKFGGPQGVGFLAATGPMCPLIVGGPQEDGRRAGTENVAGVLSMVAALESRGGPLEERVAWRDEFIAKVLRAIPGARVLGMEQDRLWNTVSLLLPSPDCRVRWVVKLDKLGVAASTGSACASGKEKPSHVLAAMGLTPEEAGRVVRFSSGWETTAAEWEQLFGAVEQVYAAMAGESLSTR
jgi:cysteine desulfurase